jgi:hypothetical protein
MASKKLSPATLAGVGPGSGCVLANLYPETIPAPRRAQASFLRRGFGLTPQRAAMVAPLAFWEARL